MSERISPSPEQLKHKYKHEIHANEIVLLAYHRCDQWNIGRRLTTLSVATTFRSEGIPVTDTFQMYEKNHLVRAPLADNHVCRKRQTPVDSRVITGNPPYLDTWGFDNNQNIAYPALDRESPKGYLLPIASTQGKPRLPSIFARIIWASRPSFVLRRNWSIRLVVASSRKPISITVRECPRHP